MFKRSPRAGGRPPAARDLTASEESFLSGLYLRLLGRRPDGPGKEVWAGRLRAGGSRDEVVRQFVTSAESLARLSAAAEGPDVWYCSESHLLMPRLWGEPAFARAVAARLGGGAAPVVLLGSGEHFAALGPAFRQQGREAHGVPWDFDGEIDLATWPAEAPALVCPVPATAEQWWAVHRLKERYGRRVVGIQELALPLAVLALTRWLLPYHAAADELLGYYLGERYFGPLEELDAVCPLAGKRVIEFGPLDGAQTAGLLRAGAASVTCVEARPENAIKTMLAAQALGWDNVRVMLDDFHNADATKYGTFDLVFAHGVYYHSVAPTLFLQNLLSLGREVFVGGFCATDDRPGGDYATLEFRGRTYRFKPYREKLEAYTAGVTDTGYYFHGDDLQDFFRHQGCEVVPISDLVMPPGQAAGRYLRFLARRP